MKLVFMIFLIFTFCASAEMKPKEEIIKDKYSVNFGGNERHYELEFKLIENDSDIKFYRTYFWQANPFIPYPYSILKDTVTHNGKTIYSRIYRTGFYGLRITPNINSSAPSHLIMSGDSNMFGIGVSDEETLPARMGIKLKNHIVHNLGLAGTGPNSVLYLLQNFDLSKVIGKKTKGVFIYDFHYYLFERVIGSKAFMAWSVTPPRYAFENGAIVYKGRFSDYWVTSFYQLLNKLPYNTILFPNLPRISKEHIQLTAKVFAQMKIEYLKQTDPKNRFVISLNPKYDSPEIKQNFDYFMECLKKEKIDYITFTSSEILDLPQITGEGHFNSVAHENYSQMLLKKLNLDSK